MDYTCEIIIDKPIDEVIKLFDNSDNLKHWMEGLQSVELLSGTHGQPGAKSKMTFIHKKREVELIETIISRDLPKEFCAEFDSPMAKSIVTASFERLTDNQTKYISKNTFQFSGLMKLIAKLFPGPFKKQSMKYLEAFKEFAEKS